MIVLRGGGGRGGVPLGGEDKSLQAESVIKSGSKTNVLWPEFHATKPEFLRLGVTFLLFPSCFVKMFFLNLHGVLSLEKHLFH